MFIILFRQICAQNKIAKLLTAPWRNMSIHVHWNPRKYKITNPQLIFRRDESIENEKLLLNLSDIKIFFRIEGIIRKTFLKKIIGIVSIRFHFLGGRIRRIQRKLVNRRCYTLFILCQKSCPLDIVIIIHLWPKFLHLVTEQFDKIKFQ